MPRKSFSFRFEWQQAIADLAPEERLEVYEQTIRYAETGKVSTFYYGRAAAAFYAHILPVFHRRAKAAEYRARRKARLAAEAAAKATEQINLLADQPDIVGPPDGCSYTPLHDHPELLGPPPAASPFPGSRCVMKKNPEHRSGTGYDKTSS